MIQQMWPYIGEFVKNLLKTSVESVINTNLPDKLKPFRFEKIDLGNVVSHSLRYVSGSVGQMCFCEGMYLLTYKSY